MHPDLEVMVHFAPAAAADDDVRLPRAPGRAPSVFRGGQGTHLAGIAVGASLVPNADADADADADKGKGKAKADSSSLAGGLSPYSSAAHAAKLVVPVSMCVMVYRWLQARGQPCVRR